MKPEGRRGYRRDPEGVEQLRPRLLAFSERFPALPLPRVPPKRLHPRLYRFVAFGDKKLRGLNSIAVCDLLSSPATNQRLLNFMSNTYLLMLLALAAGAMMPTQAATNNKMA